MLQISEIFQAFWPTGAVYSVTAAVVSFGLAGGAYYWLVFRRAGIDLPSLQTKKKNLVAETRNLKLTNQELETALQRLEETKLALTRSNHAARQHLENLVQISDAYEHISQSIEYARRIQESFLPTDHEVSTLFKEAFIYNKPRNVVSGDFCWYHENGDGSIVLVVADCTGHGVPGAFMTVLGTNLLQQVVVS